MEDLISKYPFYLSSKDDEYFEYYIKNRELTIEQVITFVNIGLHQPFYSYIRRVNDHHNPFVLVNKYLQLDSGYIPDDLERINSRYNAGEYVLRHDARIAFESMCKAAELEGIYMEAISTFRSFSYQNTVYFKNMTPETLLEDYQIIRDRVSARPGHSEHQTGLAVDINDLEEDFEDTAAGKWLAVNSHLYGFLLRYPKGKEHITGYSYEPWHFRYLGRRLAAKVYHSQLTYDEYYVRYLELPNALL